MGTDGIVDLLPLAQFVIELFHLQGAGSDLIELLAVGAVGAFDRAVEFGGARGKHEQVQSALLTGLLELGGKLRAPVDLQSADGEGHAVLQGVEELGAGLGGGAGVGLNHIPARDHVAGGELLEDHAGQRPHVEGIDFDQIARPRHGVLLGFADGIGTGAESATAAGDAAAGRLDQPALLFQLAENAAHHGDRNRMWLAVQQNGQLVLAPAGELATQI